MYYTIFIARRGAIYYTIYSMPIIGAHVSAAGGIYTCFANAKNIGAKAIQIFGASPRGWKATMPTPDVIVQYKTEEQKSGVHPVFLHAAYLVNLGTPNSKLWHASVTSLINHLKIAEALGAQGLIFHIGSSNGESKEKGIERVAKGMKRVLAAVPGESQLIMENGAGGGSKIGGTPEEIGSIWHVLSDARVKVCFDTQHAFAAGVMASYSKEEVDLLAERCDKAFGLSNIVALHVNDSKSISGSYHDRHENIGEGAIGMHGFKALAEHPYFGKLPWILEVPGFAGTGPDKKNIEILKKIVK